MTVRTFYRYFCFALLAISISEISTGTATARGSFFPGSSQQLKASRTALGFGTVVGDFGHLISGPARITREDALKAMVFSGLTAGFIIYLDRPLDDRYGLQNSSAPLGIPTALNRVGKIYDSTGSHVFVLSGTGAMLFSGLLLKDTRLLQTTGIVAESVIFTKLLTGFGKRALGRARPFTGRGARRFKGFNLKHRRPDQSLPSGHTSTIFAMMTVIAEQYDRWWVKLPAYAFATGVAFQRIYSRSHWASDVLVGGALGHLVGRTMVVRHRRQDTSSNTFQPFIRPGQIGAGIEIRF